MHLEKVTPDSIRSMKGRRPIAALTAFDFLSCYFLDRAEIPLILVGDSLGMVILGYEDTTRVTIAQMEHHLRASARANPRGLLVADLPYQSYATAAAALDNSQRLMRAGAEAVKAEGGRSILPQIQAITGAGIPFLGHLGMLPQSIGIEKKYRIKGNAPNEAKNLKADATALAESGAFGIVLELVAPAVAKAITNEIPVPTIGIASGPHCDGQILVTTDLWGTTPGRIPKHINPTRDIHDAMLTTIRSWRDSLQCPATTP